MNQETRDAFTYTAFVLYLIPIAVYLYAFRVAQRTWIDKKKRMIVFLALFFVVCVVLMSMTISLFEHLAISSVEYPSDSAWTSFAQLFIVMEVFYIIHYVFALFVRLSRLKLAKVKASRTQAEALFYANILLCMIQVLNVVGGELIDKIHD
jgi:uncharacterized membrane protein